MWDKQRIIIKEIPSRQIDKKQSTIPLEKDRYNLNVKLYLNISKIKDTYKYELYSVIDPIETFYHFYIKDIDHVFINMYFDLMEIEKRQLEIKLKNIDLKDFELVEKLYTETISSFERNTKLFCNDVRRGKDFIQLKKWNNFIYESIGIDNLKLFGFKARID